MPPLYCRHSLSAVDVAGSMRVAAAVEGHETIRSARKFSAKTLGDDTGSPCRAELHGCTACDVERHIREPIRIMRTMVTILTLREIQPFGFRAATGTCGRWKWALPSETKIGPVRHSLSGSSRCGANHVAAIQLRRIYRPENNGVEQNDARTVQKTGAGSSLCGVPALMRFRCGWIRIRCGRSPQDLRAVFFDLGHDGGAQPCAVRSGPSRGSVRGRAGGQLLWHCQLLRH